MGGKEWFRYMALLPDDIPRYVRIYDAGVDGPADRFTVVFTGRYQKDLGHFSYLGMSARPFHPQGICTNGTTQGPADTLGNVSRAVKVGGKCHLGRRIRFGDLPSDCRRAVLVAYVGLWDIKAHMCANGHCPKTAIAKAYRTGDNVVWYCEDHHTQNLLKSR